MKTQILICLGLMLNLRTSAQFINSIDISPQQPTTADTIYFYTTVSFGYGNCDAHTQYLTINANSVAAGATHCLGLLTVICTTTDTFKIDPLLAGNYTFHFNVNAGAYPAPCTPGILPGPTDSLSFTVSTSSLVKENTASNNLFSVFPIPVNDFLSISFKTKNQKRSIEFITIEGKVVGNYETDSDTFQIDTKSLQNGVYILNIFENNLTKKQLVTIHR